MSSTKLVSLITAATMATASVGLPSLASAQSLSPQGNVLIHPWHAVGIRAHHHHHDRVAVVQPPVVYTRHHVFGGGPTVVFTRHHHHHHYYHHGYYY